MWVEVLFENYYKEYAYKYSLKETPEVGDVFLVKANGEFKLVTCVRVHKEKPPIYATKPIIARMNKEFCERRYMELIAETDPKATFGKKGAHAYYKKPWD